VSIGVSCGSYIASTVLVMPTSTARRTSSAGRKKAPTAVPAIKQAVRDLTSAEAATLAATALTKGSAADV
jgi:hypothetical protein